jgi:hypothetical protein
MSLTFTARKRIKRWRGPGGAMHAGPPGRSGLPGTSIPTPSRRYDPVGLIFQQEAEVRPEGRGTRA